MNLNIAEIYRNRQLKIKGIVGLNQNVSYSNLLKILEQRADKFREHKLKKNLIDFWRISIQVLNKVIYPSLVQNFKRKRVKLVKIKVLIALKMRYSLEDTSSGEDETLFQDVEELNQKYGSLFYGSGIDISGQKISKIDMDKFRQEFG